jgi:glycosyltransferase involved in cell wall biosynthesis
MRKRLISTPNQDKEQANTPISQPPPRSDRIKIFVLLGRGFGACTWRKRYEQGLIPGINEPLPYGYHRAARDGIEIEYSQDADEQRLTGLLRRALCRTLGFDLIHVWRTRPQLLTADVIWTHTEREHLAALLLLRLLPVQKRPRVIAQSIWLFDKWSRLSWIRRWLYGWLLRQADILTTLSPDNLQIVRELLPDSRSDLVLFGIRYQPVSSPIRLTCHRPLRIASLGSDMHRDWKTLLQAFGSSSEFAVKVASTKVKALCAKNMYNVSIDPAETREHVERLYEWADIVVVPLKPNLHASGISVILEATLSRRPVIASATGGLGAYFSKEELCYVPVHDPISMRQAALGLAENNDRRTSLVRAAERRIVEAGLTSEMYALRHLRLSLEMLRLFGSAAPFPYAPMRFKGSARRPDVSIIASDRSFIVQFT